MKKSEVFRKWKQREKLLEEMLEKRTDSHSINVITRLLEEIEEFLEDVKKIEL